MTSRAQVSHNWVLPQCRQEVKHSARKEDASLALPFPQLLHRKQLPWLLPHLWLPVLKTDRVSHCTGEVAYQVQQRHPSCLCWLVLLHFVKQVLLSCIDYNPIDWVLIAWRLTGVMIGPANTRALEMVRKATNKCTVLFPTVLRSTFVCLHIGLHTTLLELW